MAGWLRRTAPEATATPARRRPQVAVLTVARDEAVMLPRWVAHYGAQVGVDNLLVLDDGSTDGSTDGLACSVHRIPGFPPGQFEGSRMRLVSGIARGLLETYDVVVFTDVDELLLADPARHDGLVDLLQARADVPVLASLALNVVHHVGVEEPLDAARPVLDQRRLAVFAPVMCKPAVKRVPAAWGLASHGIRTPYAVEPDLFMLHLKFADRDLLRAAADHRRALVEMDRRGANTTWRRTGEEVVTVLERLVADVDVDTVPEFDPADLDLGSLVVRAEKGWRTRPEGQLRALTRHRLVRVPDRLRGLV